MDNLKDKENTSTGTIKIIRKDKENTSTGTIKIIRNEPYMTYLPFERNWRSASRVLFTLGRFNETLNAITHIDRVSGEIGLDDEITIFDRIWLSPDLSTSQEVETIKPEYQGFSIIDKSASTNESVDENSIIGKSASTNKSVDENSINKERLTLLKKQYTRELIALILDEDFEYGFDTKADVLIRSQMQINALATKDWLNDIFLKNIYDKNIYNIPVLLGILRIIARLDYYEVYPQGQTMAGMSLSHENTEVQECGVRAFESWGTVQSLKILENLKVTTQWLQEYIDEVVSDLRKEYNVSTRQEN